MKIIFFTYRLPFPTVSGGQTRAFNLIKGISKKHDITLFSFYKKEEELLGSEEMKKYCSKIVTFKRRPLFSPLNPVISVFSKYPFASALYYSPGVLSRLKQELKEEKYDWVHFESFYPALYLDEDLRVKSLLGNENIEYLVYQRFAQMRPPILREVLKQDALKLKNYEEKLWKKATLNIAVSEGDAKEIEKVTGKNCPVISNGVDIEFFSSVKREEKSQTLLYVGSFRYIQNQDALRFFLKEIWPNLKSKKPSLKVLLVGQNPTKEILSYQSESVEVRTDIADIREAYQKARALIVPIRAASGTRLKILEAMASGVPVITTSLGVEGIDAKDGQEVLIANRAKDFSRQAINLLENDSLSAKMVKAAKKLVEDNYSWGKISQKLSDLYENA